MSCSAIPQPPHLGQQKWLICVFLFLYNPPALRTCSYKSVCTWSGLCGSVNFNFIKSSSWSPLWWEQSDCIWGLIQDLFFPWEACLNLTLWTPVSSVLNSAESTLLGNFWVIIHHLKPRGTCHQGMPFSHSGEVTPHAGKPLVFNLLCWMSKSIVASCWLSDCYYCVYLFRWDESQLGLPWNYNCLVLYLSVYASCDVDLRAKPSIATSSLTSFVFQLPSRA